MAHCGIGLYPVLSDVKRSGVWLEWGISADRLCVRRSLKPDIQTNDPRKGFHPILVVQIICETF